jgi:hypothetical protein
MPTPVFLRLLCVSTFLAIVHAAFTRPVVDLGYARYQGIQDAATGLTAFLGIRYAAAPTGAISPYFPWRNEPRADLCQGSLRWNPPQDPEHTDSILDASKTGPICYQATSGNAAVNPFEHPFEPEFRPRRDHQPLAHSFMEHHSEKPLATESNESEDCLVLK